MKAIQTGTRFSIYDDSVQTYDRLPAATYALCYNQQQGCFLVQKTNIQVTEKCYGVHDSKVDKVMNSFAGFSRSLGVILSGDKGIGKSMFARKLCVRAMRNGLPVILVDACVPGLASFVESIDQECVVLFDEFDKTFKSTRENDDQAALLSLFDGTAGGKKLYVVTCNELYGLNSYIVNRPGRFHYHFRFDYPAPEDIREYLHDKLREKYHTEIEKVVDFSRKTSLNYDCLRSIAFELNRGCTFAEAIVDLNIMTVNLDEYSIALFFENGKRLYNNRYQTNLFDTDGTMTCVSLYAGDGHYILDAYFDKQKVTYDLQRNAVIVPANGILIDPSEFDDDAESGKYRDVKPTHMVLTKKAMKNLHYMV